MLADEEKLDNPVWYSLTELHANFAIDYEGIKFYNPEYCPFGGFTKLEKTLSGIEKYSLLTDNFFVVGTRPVFSNKVKLDKELVCVQMVLYTSVNINIVDRITKLNEEHSEDLFNLVNLVQPGYFRSNTSKLGSYYGIYIDRILAAVTGERMKMDSYTEVSAVVTHPHYTGKGYARQLISHTTNEIFKEGKTPYLHVAESNAKAIRLYEALGFRTRRRISFWNFAAN